MVVNARGDGTAGPVLTVGHTGDRKRAGTVRDARMVMVDPGYHLAGEGEKWVMLGDSVSPSIAEFGVAPCSLGEQVGSRSYPFSRSWPLSSGRARHRAELTASCAGKIT